MTPSSGLEIAARAFRRAVQACGLAFVLAVASTGAASAALKTPVSNADSYTFAFHDADVVQVVQEVLGAVGTPYAIDPAVSGRISFRIEQRLTREQLVAAFGAILEANGFALVHNGDQLIVTPQAKAKSSAGVRRRDEGTPSAGYEVVAIPLSYAEPSEVAKALEAISASNTVVYTNDKLGLLLLGGTEQQLKTSLDSLKIFDESAFEDSKIRWFELSQAQATTVSAELEKIVQGAGLAGVSIIPLKRLNGILVFARSADALSNIAKWVIKLDTPGQESASSLWVYHPRATSAEALAATLNSLLGLQNSGTGGSGASSSSDGGASHSAAISAPTAPTLNSSSLGQSGGGDEQVRIGIDKDSNTLIVVASPGRWVQIQRILGEIDHTPKQVLIEASVLEVTLSKDFEFGVDWSVLSKDTTVSSINNSSGTVGPNFPGFSVAFINNTIQAAVHAIGSKTAVEVVSAPKIIALDNHAAHLQVGDQVPLVTQSAQSTTSPNAAVIDSVDYRSTGVILTVTPRVTGEDQVTLDVSQEVSSVAKTVSSGIDSPTIQQRRFESTLVLHDGGVVALGGLISSTRSTGDSGIPGFKDIPLIGGLFKTQSHSADRTELIVLLSAKIIRDRPTSDAVMADLFNDMHELQIRGLLPAKK